jgi:hypothetical protein
MRPPWPRSRKMVLGTSLIAYLLLVWLKFKSTVRWGLLGLTRLAQTMLLARLDLGAMLGLRPPDNRQPLLFNERAGQQSAPNVRAALKC